MGSSQLADSLQWIAYALFIVFLAQVVTSLFPIALIQPQWLVRVSATLRGTASLPLIAVALLMLANLLDGDVMPSSDQLRLIRRLATIAAIGFLLLIPIQSYGAVTGIRNQVQQRQGELKKLADAANQVQKATNEAELREAIRAIPGGEQLANRPLGADVQTIKTGLLARLRPSVKRLENQLKDSQNEALQNTIGPLIRDGIIALAYAIGFAGMGYSKSGQPTPLRRLFKSHNPRLLKEQRGINANPVPE
ncbi:MAG: HpsJ family protein [Cyanobacteriota bacterium]|nr:HpsJ family protein [Cyanobacteriota bacterium]